MTDFDRKLQKKWTDGKIGRSQRLPQRYLGSIAVDAKKEIYVNSDINIGTIRRRLFNLKELLITL